MTALPRSFSVWTIGLIALPVLVFGGLLYAYALNIPWYDDIEAFVAFLPAYDRAPSAGEKLYWLLKPNNEHRIFFGKFVTVAIARLTGELNFRYIILVGGLCLLGILTLFGRVFRWPKTPWLWFTPVPFVLLHPQFHLASLWAITSMQHIGATFFVMLSLYLLAKPASPGRLGGAVLAQTVASLSMSNGLFGWVAGGVVLLVQRRYGRLAGWVAISALVIWFYFHDFASPQGNETSISFFLKHPHLVFFGFFTFIGALFDFVPNQPILWRSVLPTLAGFGIVGSIAWLAWQQRWWQKPAGQVPADRLHQRYFWLGGYTFLLVNAAVVAFLRPRFGYDLMLISNYMLYPALWICLLYMHWISERATRTNRTLAVALSGGVLVWAMSYTLNWPKVHKWHQALQAYGFNQRNAAIGLAGQLNTPLADYVDQHMREVVRLGYYHYPAIHPALPDSTLLRPAASVGPVVPQPATITSLPDRWQIELLPSPALSARNPAFMLLQSDAYTYLLGNQVSVKLASFALNRPVMAVQVEAYKGSFRPGRYRLGWATTDGAATPVIRYTDQFLVVE